MKLRDRIVKRLFRWTIRMLERRIEKLGQRLGAAHRQLYALELRESPPWVLHYQKEYVEQLEERVTKTRQHLLRAQETYVRAYVSRFWRGKAL